MPHSLASSASTADMARKFGPSLNLTSLAKKVHRDKKHKTDDSHLDKSSLESKRARLEELLYQQYLAKYGVKKDGANVNTVIKDAISGFISRTDLSDISQAAASGEVDSIVRNAIANAKNKAPKPISQSISSQNFETKPSSSLTAQQKQDLMLPINNKTEEIRVNQWAILAEMERVAEEKRKMKEMQERTEHQRELKQMLDRQTREHEEQMERARQEKAALLQQSLSKAKVFEEEQEHEKTQRLKSFEVERAMRLQQMESRQRARQSERDRKIAEERLEMERVQRVLEEEEERKQQRKVEEKRMKEVAIVENEKLRQAKMAEQRVLRDQDREMTRAYAAKLEREEKLRAAAFQSRMDALSKIGSIHHESVGSVMNAQEAERESKERAAIEAKYERDAERERQKKERLKTSTMEALKDNQMLVREREIAKEREREEDKRMRERLDKENEEVRRKQDAEERRKKAEAEATRQAQEQQASERARNKRVGHTDEADQLIVNKLIQQRVQADPELYQRAVEKILTVRSDRRTLPRL